MSPSTIEFDATQVVNLIVQEEDSAWRGCGLFARSNLVEVGHGIGIAGAIALESR